MPGLQTMFKGITKNSGMGYAWVTEDFKRDPKRVNGLCWVTDNISRDHKE